MSEEADPFSRRRKRTQFETEPITSRRLKRLPNFKSVEFKFPPVVDPNLAKKYDERKIAIISDRDFKRMFTGYRKENLFIGSLKLL
jgi:hypothetical protein